MTQQRSFRECLPFPVASVLIFIYLTINIINRFINDFVRGRESYSSGYWDEIEPWYATLSIDGWLWLVLLLTLAIFMLIKKPNVGITVLLGSITTLEIYWFIENTGYFSYFNIHNLSNVLIVLAFALLTAQSISTYSGSRMAFCNAIWFLPGLLAFTEFTLFLIRMISWRDAFGLIVHSLQTLFYCLVVSLIGRWLFEVACIKHPDPNRPNETVYNFRAPQPNYVRPPVSPYAPQPPMPPVPPAPHVPVAPAPIVPHSPYAPAPAPATPDPVQELTKYKEMLDNDLITQEEYDAKKKQLLNL